MNKKLPGIFANQINKDIKNNDKFFYSKLEDNKSDKNERNEQIEVTKNNLNVNQKINNIFNSTKYVYKADVKITLETETIECRIIGRNSTHLITMDNKLIPISSIIDIEFIN